jgi:hypothetical protein
MAWAKETAVKRKKTALALTLSIPLLLEGAVATAATAAESTYPSGSPPAEAGPEAPTSPGLPGPSQTAAGPSAPKGSLPVTGGDVAALAVVGTGAVVIGFALNSATGRRRYGELVPSAVHAASGRPPREPDLRMSREVPTSREKVEGPTVSTYEHQFRIAPEALERTDLLDGLEGPIRDRLAAVLQSAATSYRATLDELEATRSGGAEPAAGDRTDRFAELGEHVAWVLRASHDAAEEERRRAREEIEATRAETVAELAKRRDEVDELERRAAERLRLADEEATTKVAAAREQAEQHASTVRAEAEVQLSSLLHLQESLRVQLVEASQELRRSLDSLGGPTEPPTVA